MKPEDANTAADLSSPPPALLGLGRDEFPEGASEFTDEPSRRRFLALMGASMALAGAAGCNLRPAAQRKILPYTTQPDEVTPGVPTYYASAAPVAGYGQGVLVRSNEGRPTKIEGNPDHPSSLGGAGLHALASVLDVYDPDRSKGVTRHGNPASYEQAVAALRGKLFGVNGITPASPRPTIRILTENVTSPTLTAQITQLLATFDGAKWVRFDAISNENARTGTAKAFGKPVNVTYDFLKADVVVSLDADFLCSGPGHVRYARDFGDRRKIRADGKNAAELAAGRVAGKPFKEGIKVDFDPKADLKDSLVNRLYAIETMPTNTGAVADHRVALTSAQIVAFARTLAFKLGVPGIAAAGEWNGDQTKFVDELAKDLQDEVVAETDKDGKPLKDKDGKPVTRIGKSRKGKTIVVAGEHLPASVHTIVAAINSHLGNIGQTVLLSAPVEAEVAGKMSDLKTLTDELKAKSPDVLIILGGANPAYSAPVDVKFEKALRDFGADKSKFSLHVGSHQDETGVLCEWHINEAHYLETWGDIRGHDGTVSIQQPLIAPLHNGRSAIEVIAAVLPIAKTGVTGAPRDPMEIVKATTKAWFDAQKKTGPFETFWQESVRSGVIAGSASAAVTATLATDWAKDASGPLPAPVKDTYELNFRACPALFDGRHANNGWLQELPKPLTKISWDNAAFVSPNTAKKLSVETRFDWNKGAGEHGRAEVRVIELEVGGEKVKAPVWILPGHADGAITVHLGHGRERAGNVAGLSSDMNVEQMNPDGKAVHGFNAYPLRSSTALWATTAKIAVTAKKYLLACTQGHWSAIEKDPISGKPLDRKPVRHQTLSEYKTNPMYAKIPPMATGETKLINENVPLPKADPHHKHEHGSHDHDNRLVPLNMYAPAEGLVPGLREFQRRRWAIALDLNACTGCSACVVACQSENNTPVVGKDQVTKGREMYWISIDRYYEGPNPSYPEDLNDSNAVRAYFQPRMCVQCENAPCEIVCPVGATVHSADGLNDMAYNRCVGTRYCSNNCPYKVRRFNFLTLQDWSTESIKLGRNPDVSVRSRGVMEKCTFCVQRIRGAEIVAERELALGQRKEPDPAKGEVLIKDGEILTACQAACPSGAIVFGDINDPHAAVSRWKNEPQNYGLLAELNTRPRLTHMGVVRNPNPKLVPAAVASVSSAGAPPKH